ncbi:MAG: hypothetical protein H7832_02290 [Magnetococcus sp. DMHC-6]
MSTGPIHRGVARVLSNQALPGSCYHLRLFAPEVAQRARPGSFIHLTCHPSLTLPRPFSIFNAQPNRGEISILYKVVGQGTTFMANWQVGNEVVYLGPIGKTFSIPDSVQRVILIAGGIGVAPLEFLASTWMGQGREIFLFWGVEGEAPFELGLSDHILPGFEAPFALEPIRWQELNIPARLASVTRKEGYYLGYVTDLARQFIQALPTIDRRTTAIYACGPTPMLAATARLAKQFHLGGELSLEERMGCGIGGCAGCVVPIWPDIKNKQEWNYQRVCVDGPVFAIDQMAWEDDPLLHNKGKTQ